MFDDVAISTRDPEGVWYNQLGSTLELISAGGGFIWGIYTSAVGNSDVKGYYSVNGYFDVDPPTSVHGVSIGWTVTFQNNKRNNAHSTATWSGQFFDDAGGGGERILTQWLLTTSTPPGPKPEHIWNSTYLGHDTFTRKKPSAAEIARARASNVDSPYLEDILAHSQGNNNEVAIVAVDWGRLNGFWYNELGSKMRLNIFDERGGEFNGEYNSTVGKAVDSYDLSGWVDSDPPRGQGISIGWALSYRKWNDAQVNAHSTAAWSGQFFDDTGHHDDHGGKIFTQWLLTTSTLPGPKNTWNSTHFGRDKFTRKKPSDDEIAQARAMTCMTPRMEDILAML